MTSQLPDRRSGGRAAVAYTAWRLALLLACGLVCWLAGLRGLPLLVVAFFLSGAVSLFVLSRQRAAMSVGVDRVVGGMRARARRRTEEEDAYVERVMTEQHRTTRSDR